MNTTPTPRRYLPPNTARAIATQAPGAPLVWAVECPPCDLRWQAADAQQAQADAQRHNARFHHHA